MKRIWGIAILMIGIEAQALGLLPFSKQTVPNAEAVSSWQEIPGYRDSDIDPMTMPRTVLQCVDKVLYPTHPQQNTKHYHLFLSARYDHTRLKGGDEACALSSKYLNAKGVKPCLRPDYFEYTVISDLYRDSCGHVYRGFWDVGFLKSNDNMGVLFAKGRTLYPKPGAGGVNDMYVGDTYGVEVGEFLFLSPPFKGDAEELDAMVKDSRSTHVLEGFLWKARLP